MIRPSSSADHEAIKQMLAEEGIPIGRMMHKVFDTYCAEEKGQVVGFYTMREEHGLPSLQHFCVRKDHRQGRVMRELACHMRDYTRGTPFIIHCARGDDRTRRAIEAYFRVKPYGKTDDKLWYFVEAKR